MRRLGLAFAVGIVIMLAALPVSAASVTWKLYSFNASGYALSSEVAKLGSNGVSVGLPTDTFTGAAYLTSAKTAPVAGGLSATVSIAADAGTTYTNWPGCTNSITNPTVGLYFDTKASGRFDPSNYWWSSTRIPLSTLTTAGTLLTTSFSTPAAWTNYYGKPGDQTGTYVVDGVTYPSAANGFARASTNIASWGVSFGGDCFYANGVAASNGSAVFTLAP